MTDKEKIRAEIIRRIEEEQRIRRENEKLTGVGSVIDTRYESLLSFIDSMQEDSVSEDLEEAAKTYAKKESHGYEPCNIVETFKDGAKWQEEQMFKDAVICVVEPRYNKEIGRYLSLGIVMNEQIYKAGDIVKLIIIKEGKQ